MPRRMIEMDMLRALSVLAVITVHVAATVLLNRNISAAGTSLLFMVLHQAANFAVPVFILLSGMGMMLSGRHYDGYLPFLSHRLRRIAPAYLLWSAIYMVANLILSGKPVTLESAAMDLLGGTASFHLYFIPLILQAYLLFPLLREQLRSTSFLLICLGANGAVVTATQYANISAELSPLLSPEVGSSVSAILADDRNVLNWIFYFALGTWLAVRADRILFTVRRYSRVLLVAVVVLVAGLVVESYVSLFSGQKLHQSIHQVRPTVMVYTIVFAVCVMSCRWNGRKVTEWLETIARYSYGIYLSHYFVQMMYEQLLIRIGYGNVKGSFWYGITAIIVVLFGSVLLSVIGDLISRRWRRAEARVAVPA